jgi:hypothetical protein
MKAWLSHRAKIIQDSLAWRSPLVVAVLAVREFFSPLFYWYAWHIFETDISREISLPYSKEHPEIRFFTSEQNSPPLQAQISSLGELQPAEIQQRFSRGDLIAIAYVEEQPAGYMWMSLSNGLELAFNTNWIIHPGEAVRYGSFVAPKFRGRRIHSTLNSAVNFYLRERGVTRTLGSISVLNLQSLSLPRHYQRARAMTLFVARIRGLNWTFRKSFRAPLNSRFSWPHSTRGSHQKLTGHD